MDVVVLHSDHIVRAGKIDRPVVASVTSGTPAGLTVEFIVGERDSIGCTVSGNKHLAADERELTVI